MERGRKLKGLNTLKVAKEADQLERQQNQYLEFARLHFERAEAFPLIRSLSRTHISRNLYLVEPPEDNPGFESHFQMKLETKFKIPLRNAELVMKGEGDANVGCSSKGGVKRKRCIKLRPQEHKLNVVNSCNGLLCLSAPSLNETFMVCNPIMGEFINLPVPTQASSKKFIDSGLGFSPKTNEYKVIRIFDRQERPYERIREPLTGREFYSGRVAEIRTLGTRSWKRIGYAPCSYLEFPNRFESVPQPPFGNEEMSLDMLWNMSLGTLRGRLCLSPKFLKVHGIKSKYEAIAHIPSFISLKDTVTYDDLEVLNITSRCAGFKLQGETKSLFLEIEDLDSDIGLLSDLEDGDIYYGSD
ncbi:hypothetical protein RHSIM_RhsimUnG0082800 [Rhododendron simsii]|uniref:F-box associated beta-propeller type 3 domain-containing protein n=1 Tax=Rhododendron simsii TaxID=118357 RepID=A0A834G1X8_RHOSS|nr:hypothetical protein RHSIM_RhsimUnG0082800 [Rhododendron simsii]